MLGYIIVAIVFSVFSLIWGYRRACESIVHDIQTKSYFTYGGRVYECSSIYKGKTLAQIEALQHIPSYAHPLTQKIDLPIAPVTLDKIKFLSEDAKDKILKESDPDSANLKRLFNFPPSDYKHCCLACLDKDGYMRDRMYMCSICGNKRCPKAENHKFKCTNSNAVGQKGELEIFYVGIKEE